MKIDLGINIGPCPTQLLTDLYRPSLKFRELWSVRAGAAEGAAGFDELVLLGTPTYKRHFQGTHPLLGALFCFHASIEAISHSFSDQ